MSGGWRRRIETMKPSPNSVVRFRELCHSDAPLLFAGAFGDESVTRFLQWDTHRAVEETRLLVDEMVGQHKRKEKFFWIASSVKDRRPVGLGSLKPDTESGWIGFLVFRGEHRKGIGTAMLASLEEAVYQSYEGASAAVSAGNRPSISLLKRAGWTLDATAGSPDFLVYRKDRSEPTGGINERSACARRT